MALARSIPLVKLRITWMMAERILLLPPLPMTNSGPAFPMTIVGDIIVGNLCCLTKL